MHSELCDGCKYYDNTSGACCRDDCVHLDYGTDDEKRKVRKKIINVPRKREDAE